MYRLELNAFLFPRTFVAGDEFTLLFQAPIAEDATLRYDAELRDPTGGTIWEQEGVESIDAFGSFLVVARARNLTAGVYTLALHERDLTNGETRHTFRYGFRLEIER